MAEHRVKVVLPSVEVRNKDLRIRVKADGKAYGELTLSRGGLGWYPRSKARERHITWSQFDKLMRHEFGEEG